MDDGILASQKRPIPNLCSLNIVNNRKLNHSKLKLMSDTHVHKISAFFLLLLWMVNLNYDILYLYTAQAKAKIEP